MRRDRLKCKAKLWLSPCAGEIGDGHARHERPVNRRRSAVPVPFRHDAYDEEKGRSGHKKGALKAPGRRLTKTSGGKGNRRRGHPGMAPPPVSRMGNRIVPKSPPKGGRRDVAARTPAVYPAGLTTGRRRVSNAFRASTFTPTMVRRPVPRVKIPGQYAIVVLSLEEIPRLKRPILRRRRAPNPSVVPMLSRQQVHHARSAGGCRIHRGSRSFNPGLCPRIGSGISRGATAVIGAGEDA